MILRRLTPLFLLLALIAGCGGDSGSSSDTSAAEVLKKASKPAKSADVKFELEATLKGASDVDSPAKFSLEGPYRSNGPKSLPDLDWKLHAEGDGESFDARLITTSQNAWVDYKGRTYEVGEQLIGSLSQQLKAQPSNPQGLGMPSIEGWFEDPEVEDSEVGGVPTTRVSGDVDMRKALESIREVIQKSVPSGQAAPQLSDQTIDEIADAVEEAHVETDIGRDDGVLRRNSLELSFEVPESRRAQVKGLEGGDVKLTFEQTDVNGDQEVTPPTNAAPIQELLRGLGIPPQLLGPGVTPQLPG